MDVIDSICATTRLMAKSLFEMTHAGIRAKGGWVVGVLKWVWMRGPVVENCVPLSIIPNGWPAPSSTI